MVKVNVYVEGGGDRKDLQSKCRKGFKTFFKKSNLPEHKLSVIACGSRDEALKRFRIALQNADTNEMPLLLVDSEASVQQNVSAWEHLLSRDPHWIRPVDATDAHTHLMVQCMEAWFLADKAQVEKFFGAGFRSNALANRPDIENILKNDVLSQLKNASLGSQKGGYHKGRHSFDLLEQIDPNKVVQCSPYAKKLIETLRSLLIA